MSKLCALVVSLLAMLASSAPPALPQTQAGPQKPVRFILPFGPGAGADIGARLIQDRLQARWGKPVVIENRPGGDSMIAIQAVLAANDDHTFLWGPSGSFIVHPYQYRSEEHTSELQSQSNLVCRLLLEKKKKKKITIQI